MDLFTLELGLLFLAAICAGAIDAVAGGGGLIGLPALLLYGVNPIQALATNKLQSTVGKVVATIRYARAGLYSSITLREMLVKYAIPCAIGGMLGAFCATKIDTRILELAIPIVLILTAISFALNAYRQKININKKSESKYKNKSSKKINIFSNFLFYIIAYYDGLFGPGAGTFYLVVLTDIKNVGLRVSIALVRILNMSSNIGAILIFALAAGFAWRAWIVMALGQIVGAGFGSLIALRVSIFALWLLVCGATLAIAIVLLLQ